PRTLSLRNRSFLRIKYTSTLLTRITGRRLDMACNPTFSFSPQPRQNFVSSLFWIPHFGQYIEVIPNRALLEELTLWQFPLFQWLLPILRYDSDEGEGDNGASGQ